MENHRLFIIGAGDFGRELEGHLALTPPAERNWTVAGFLDDSPGALGGYPSDYDVVGGIKDFAFQPGDLAVMAIAAPSPKKKVFEILKGRVEFLTFIAPDAIIGKFTRIGQGCVIGPRVIIGPNVTLGDGVFVNSCSMLGHDVTVGDYTSFMANNNIAGHCKIGAGAFFASSITVIPKREICDGANVGAGSVVIRHIRDTTTVFGNPAKPF